MAFYKNPSALKRSILGFVQHMVSKTLYNDIKALLEPCCPPTIVFDTYSCDSDPGATGILFENVTITCSLLAGQTVTAILTSTDDSGSGGAIKVITLDSNGVWNGDLQSSWWNSDGTQTVTLTLIPENSRVITVSESQELTSLPNCD